jgi:hypothetical protein
MNFEETRAEWLVSSYAWLNKQIAKKDNQRIGRIVLPTSDFFPFKNTRDHRFASAVFEQIRVEMEITDWSCELVCDEDAARNLTDSLSRSGVLGANNSSGAAGTFGVAEDHTVEISYSSRLLKDPPALVATLAHELSHYLMATIKDEPPGGWCDLEPLTDLTAVKEGFGIFLCESAFRFSQFSDGVSYGWEQSTQGYLRQTELAFCLALYARLNEVDVGTVARFLGRNPREYFALALEDIADHEDWLHELKASNK